MEIIYEWVNYAVDIFAKSGYLGIFLGMFLESTLFPIPSEAIMIPAGILVYKGVYKIHLVLLYATLGNLSGAVFSYYIARIFGMLLFEKYGKYFFVKKSTFDKVQNFFEKYGAISVFMGRLLPGFRHFISIPAGIAKMNFKIFCFFTILGSFIWNVILLVFGYYLSYNEKLIKIYLHKIIILILIIFVIICCYKLFSKKLSTK